MDTTGRFGRREWLLVLGFLLSLGVTGVFAVRSFQAASALHHDQPIRPWMTVPYVAHSYHVPASGLYSALGLSAARPRDRRTLAEIARSQGRPVGQVIAELQQAIAQERAASPPTPARTPATPRGSPSGLPRSTP